MILSFLFLIFLYSCEKSDADTKDELLAERTFELYASQSLSPEGRNIFLNILSSEADTCLNAELDAQLEIQNSDMLLELKDINYPDLCESGLVFLQEEFAIANTPGNYTLELKKGEMASSFGNLFITEDYVELDIESSQCFFVAKERMAFIKENHVWGFFAYRNILNGTPDFALEEVVSDFYSILRGYEDIPSGYYQYFSVSENGSVTIPELDENAVPVAVNLTLEGGWENLKSSLELLSNSNEDLFFMFTNGKGQNHHN